MFLCVFPMILACFFPSSPLKMGFHGFQDSPSKGSKGSHPQSAGVAAQRGAEFVGKIMEKRVKEFLLFATT